MLENAKGFAIFTVFKAGFLFSARAGSGVVIAKLQDGSELSLFDMTSARQAICLLDEMLSR